MSERTCGWCGEPIDHMRSNATYCSRQHKKNAASKRHRERNPGYYAKFTNSPTAIAYRERNREHLRAVARENQRRYRAVDPKHNRDWWAANRDKHVLYQRQRVARKRSNPGSVGVAERDWLRMKNRYEQRCAYCGDKAPLHMDHVIPLVRGGRHAIGNVLPACKSCNSSKSARFISEWKWRRAGFPPAA